MAKKKLTPLSQESLNLKKAAIGTPDDPFVDKNIMENEAILNFLKTDPKFIEEIKLLCTRLS